MKKKLLASVLAVSMVFSISACGSKTSDTVTTTETTESATDTVSQEVSSESGSTEGGNKIAMICDSSVNDGGWGASCYNAMVTVADEMGWENAYTDNVATSDYVTAMTEYAELGYQVIFAPGNQYSDAVAQVAEEYPDVSIILLNGTIETNNITSVLPDANQIGQMAGALAGLMSTNGNIGFIGGMEIDTTKAKLASYEAAAKKINPDMQVYSAYAGSYSDTAKGKEIASSMIADYDVDVMFGDASAVDTGAREALSEYEGKYDIGQPGDLGSADDPVIINSVVTDNAAMLKLCLEDYENGTFGNKTIYGNLDNGCLSVGTFSNAVPEEVKAEYLAIIEEIKTGTFLQ